MHKKQFLNISQSIINSKNINEEFLFAKQLSDFFNQFHFSINESIQQQSKIETIINGGIALSSVDAASCLDDPLRTVRFIKGAYLAIKELFTRFPGQKINILYAGCGPYAALLLPALPFVNKEHIRITLIDINISSIQSVKELLAILDLQDYVHDIVLANAVTYKHPEAQPLHLVISETMFHALIREPQVAITANLAPQIIKNGILLPKEIKLDLAYTFFAKEPYLQKNPATMCVMKNESNSTCKRRRIDTLFSMNKENNFSDKTTSNSCLFESAFYELPGNFDNHPDICIFTYIKIFKELQLSSAESFITNPYCIESLYNVIGHTHFKMIYDFRGIPNWNYKLRG